MPIARSVRTTRTAISPRLATRTVSNTAQHPPPRVGSGRLAGAPGEDLIGLVQLDQAALLDRVPGRERPLREGPQGAPLAARLVLAALLLGHAPGLPHTVRLAFPSRVVHGHRRVSG